MILLFLLLTSCVSSITFKDKRKALADISETTTVYNGLDLINTDSLGPGGIISQNRVVNFPFGNCYSIFYYRGSYAASLLREIQLHCRDNQNNIIGNKSLAAGSYIGQYVQSGESSLVKVGENHLLTSFIYENQEGASNNYAFSLFEVSNSGPVEISSKELILFPNVNYTSSEKFRLIDYDEENKKAIFRYTFNSFDNSNNTFNIQNIFMNFTNGIKLDFIGNLSSSFEFKDPFGISNSQNENWMNGDIKNRNFYFPISKLLVVAYESFSKTSNETVDMNLSLIKYEDNEIFNNPNYTLVDNLELNTYPYTPDLKFMNRGSLDISGNKEKEILLACYHYEGKILARTLKIKKERLEFLSSEAIQIDGYIGSHIIKPHSIFLEGLNVFLVTYAMYDQLRVQLIEENGASLNILTIKNSYPGFRIYRVSPNRNFYFETDLSWNVEEKILTIAYFGEFSSGFSGTSTIQIHIDIERDNTTTTTTMTEVTTTKTFDATTTTPETTIESSNEESSSSKETIGAAVGGVSGLGLIGFLAYKIRRWLTADKIKLNSIEENTTNTTNPVFALYSNPLHRSNLEQEREYLEPTPLRGEHSSIDPSRSEVQYSDLLPGYAVYERAESNSEYSNLEENHKIYNETSA